MEESKQKAIRWLMIAVGVWGSLIALGVLLPAEWDWSKWTKYDVYGCLIVLALTGTLLGVWQLFLMAREARRRR